MLPNGPDVSYGHAAVVVGTDIYYIGGVGSSGSARYTVYKYSTTSNTWTTVASIPTAFYYAAAGYYNGKIYIHGGYNNNNVFKDVWVYTP